MSPDINRIQRDLPDVAVKFIHCFMRFENALKYAGYLRNREPAEADWSGYVGDLDASFFDEVSKARQATTLIAAPPKKRVNRHGRLEWRDVPQVTNAASLFKAICRARNNLFHGDKFIGDPAGDARGAQLLKESLWVLEYALSKGGKVKKAFDAHR